MSGVFTEPEQYYIERHICFDAEAGYNMLSGTVAERSLSSGASLNGLLENTRYTLTDMDTGELLAVYAQTDGRMLLIKNPYALDQFIAGQRNALGIDHKGDLALYYSRDCCTWQWGRKANFEPENIYNAEVLNYKNIPQIELLIRGTKYDPRPTTFRGKEIVLAELISDEEMLDELGFAAADGDPTAQNILEMLTAYLLDETK
ncbi:hypothetical protein JW978_03060 [Candidatus Dojkabacteria bacterium]|nr:hypothetical protein [Candidatus Dojkabacteria bacterium]